MNEFYALARLCLVKDEKHYDKFDKAFGAYFQGLDSLPSMMEDAKIPAEWMRKEFERMLSKEEMDKIEALGGLDKVIEEFKKRLEEQHKRHHRHSEPMATTPKAFVLIKGSRDIRKRLKFGNSATTKI